MGADPAGGELHFEVTDTGIGIGPETPGRCAVGLIRTTRRPPRFGGTGLGLAILKEADRDHGRNRWGLSSERGKGSCFYFDIDASIVQEVTPAATTPARERPPPQDCGCWIVEDNRTNRTILHDLVNELGISDGTAESGNAGAGAIARLAAAAGCPALPACPCGHEKRRAWTASNSRGRSNPRACTAGARPLILLTSILSPGETESARETGIVNLSHQARRQADLRRPPSLARPPSRRRLRNSPRGNGRDSAYRQARVLLVEDNP